MIDGLSQRDHVFKLMTKPQTVNVIYGIRFSEQDTMNPV